MRRVGKIIGINLAVDALADLRPVLQGMGLQRWTTAESYAEAELWERERLRSGLLHLFQRPTFERGHIELVIEEADCTAALDDLFEKGLLASASTIHVPADHADVAGSRLSDSGVPVRTYSPGFFATTILVGHTPAGLEFELFYTQSRPGYEPPRLEGVVTTVDRPDDERSFWDQVGVVDGRAISGQAIRVEEGQSASYAAVIHSATDECHAELNRAVSGLIELADDGLGFTCGGLTLLVEPIAA